MYQEEDGPEIGLKLSMIPVPITHPETLKSRYHYQRPSVFTHSRDDVFDGRIPILSACSPFMVMRASEYNCLSCSCIRRNRVRDIQ